MAINRSYNNLAYGFNNALQSLAPAPILAQRAPSSSDVAELGTLWIYQGSPVEMYIFTSGGTWTELTTDSGAGGPFSSLTVNGATALNGALTVNSGASAIAIGTDAVAKTITLGNSTGATSITMNAGTGGVSVGANAIAHTVTIGNGTGASQVVINSGTAGVQIGNNAVAQTVTIGNVTGASAVVVEAGTGGIALGSAAGTHVSTAPVNSNVATSAFVTSLTAGTSVQNTTGYDLLCNISLIVSSSTTATITLGVGSATGPTTSTVVPSFTTASSIIIPIVAWVPNNYYLVYNHTGTITVASATVQSCAL